MQSGCSKFKAGTGQMDAAAAAAAASILPRWAKLIGEYEALRDALREHTQQPHWPGVAPYIAMLKTEASFAAKTLEAERRKVEEGLDDEESTPFAVSQALTNIAARETMWRLIKTSPQGGLVALERKFPRKPPTTSVKAASQYRRWGSVSGMHASGSRASDGVFVNAVMGDGFEWLRVLTLTTPQLLVSMAENGWEWGEESEGEEGNLEAIADIPLVATILGLVDGARDNRSRGAYPHICVILTRVEEDDPSVKGADEVKRFLRVLRGGLAALASTLDRDIDGRRLAVTVHTARSPRALAQPGDNSLKETLAQLMPDLAHQLTPTLNIDTSILIALASDISHQAVAVRRWFPHQRVDEIAHERARPGQMLQGLCAAMRGRRLVCTREAARAFRTMVRDMGQASEKERAAVLIFGGGGEDESESAAPPQAALVERYRALSQHPHYVPDDLLLPIRVIDEAWDMARIQKEADNAAAGPSHMPAVAYRVAQEMNASVPTLSVFFYGWASGHATLTTNSTARNKILRLLEKHRSSSRQQGPHVRLCRPVRSLNGTNPRGCDDDDDDDDDEADEACGPSYD